MNFATRNMLRSESAFKSHLPTAIPEQVAIGRRTTPSRRGFDSTSAVAIEPLQDVQGNYMMHLIIDVHAVTTLRRIALGSFGKVVSFMRTASMPDHSRLSVWLALPKPAIAPLMAEVMRRLPAAEFGSTLPLSNAANEIHG